MKTKILLIALACATMISACKKQNGEESQSSDIKQNDCNCSAEQALPDTKAELISFGSGNKQIQIERKNGIYILGGDMELTQKQVDFIKRQYNSAGVATESTFKDELKLRWPGGVVYYVVDSNMNAKKKKWVTDAIAHWESKTKFTFVQRDKEANYVRFVSGDGCSSSIGMVGGRQNITLGNCSLGSTIHEIGHAIGLLHEQCRADRDDFIIVNKDNIEDGKAHNFQTYIERGWTGGETGDFDFGSIMLYSSNAFSKNGEPTITKLDGTTFTGQRKELSEGDLAGIKFLYPDSVFTAK
ncbi:hypothetical protein TH53_21685 [Pedobacter lusitanus]|uniref:Peptidase M12A domain-containing protein n=1 Tax=Pedobacter lusitanus TaxID=1503925 RepID=A0A0D0FRY2_9SPHI|nr:M12 family metallopeptidase [Pedobacter lusitanus]KIO75229.1 hypothetical protein TH53_21685 [Pedobacter lusitanus]